MMRRSLSPIAGIDSLIDTATTNIPEAQRGFRAISGGQTSSLRKPRAGVFGGKIAEFWYRST